MFSIRVLLVCLLGLQGCAVHDLLVAQQAERIDAWANPWLGHTKAARIAVIGPPDLCTTQNGSEVCEWSSLSSINIPSQCAGDVLYAGHPCGSGGSSSREHRILYTYRDGIATEWDYRGSWGERSSRSSRTNNTEPGQGQH